METQQHVKSAGHGLGEGDSIARVEGFDHAVVGDVHKVVGRVDGDPVSVPAFEGGFDLAAPDQQIGLVVPDDPDVLYPVGKVLMVGAIAPDHHVLESGEMDAVLAH